MQLDWQPIILSLKLSAITTAILLIVGVPFAYWLSSIKARWKPLLEALVSLPLVLPPSVLGFYLLISFSPASTIGAFLLEYFDIRLVFSFGGLILASVLYSLPFMIQPVQSGFQGLSPSFKEAAYTLGASPFRTFIQVMIPNIKPSLLSGIVLTFAHTMGEFGVVLMIGGNIPGETKVASIAIYDEVESLHYAQADFYALILLILSFVMLAILFSVNRSWRLKEVL